MQNKVVRFPGVEVAPPVEISDQLELFVTPQKAAQYFCFADIAGFDQAILLNVLAKNSVTTLVDIRDVPVFERPYFNHAEVVEYLNDSGIIYFEYAIARMQNYIESDYKIARTIHARRRDGLTLCLYDESCLDCGLVADLRAKFTRSNLFSVELSARALVS